MARQLFGRTQIFTDTAEITRDNVVQVLEAAKTTHDTNANEIQYLYDYYRGKTPILSKQKEVRPSINNQINENRAHEIVNFKLGYTLGEPIQYIGRNADPNLSDEVNRLNEFTFAASKASADRELAEWMYVGGVGYRMVLPNPVPDEEEPFKVYTLDPRYSFVVRYNGLGEEPLMGVKYITKEDQTVVYSVYTKDAYYEISNSQVKRAEANPLGEIPIIEYPANTVRQGAFEIVLSLLDAINEVESNRLDDLVQSVNSFLALLGGNMDEDAYAKLEDWKMLCLPEGVDAKYLSVAMQQGDVQTLADNLYQNVLTICGIPNRNGGSSTSDTGSAVIMRDGWEAAEANAKAFELMFKRSEKKFLRLVLLICSNLVGTNLRLKDIEIKFSRRNYEGIQTKSQVLTTMLSNPKIHPMLAFQHCGMFLDPEGAYLLSKEWWEVNADAQSEGNEPKESPEVGEGEGSGAGTGGDPEEAA